MILDPYGIDIPETFRNRLFGKDDFTIAINLNNGELFVAGFDVVEREHIPTNTLFLSKINEVGYKIPSFAQVVGRSGSFFELTEGLLTKKRPVRISFDSEDLISLFEREIGFPDLHPIIHLDIKASQTLEVGPYGWRITSNFMKSLVR